MKKSKKKAETQLTAVENRLKELSKIETTVEIEERTLTDTGKEIEALKKNLEADKLILKLETDNENRAEVKKYIKEDISEIQNELFELRNERFEFEIQAFLNESKLKDSIDGCKKYLTEFSTAVINLVNIGIDKELNELEDTYNDDIDDINKKYDIQEESYEEYLKNIAAMKKEYEGNISDLEDEKAALEAKKLEVMTEDEYEALEQEIANKETEVIAEKEKYQDLIDADKKYVDERTAIDNQYAVDKAELELKAAEHSRKVSLVNAHISLAESLMAAVTAGMKTAFPLVFVPTFTALALATGGLQIAAIASTELPTVPTFATGGYVSSEHANNYKSLGLSAPNNTDNTLAWLATGERVLTPQQNNAYEKLAA